MVRRIVRIPSAIFSVYRRIHFNATHLKYFHREPAPAVRCSIWYALESYGVILGKWFLGLRMVKADGNL